MSNPNYLAADVANLAAEIDSLFTAYPELAEDAELRSDVLEGETNLYEVLTRLVGIERDADSLSKAIAGRIGDLSARRQRAERQKEAMRALMLRLLKAANVRKAQLIEATVSVSKGRDSVEITDESVLPEWAYETERKPLKKEIMAKLAANENVAGARKVEGTDTITVRVA